MGRAEVQSNAAWVAAMKARTPKPAALAATHEFQLPKSPRQWAADICRMDGREQRRKMLEKVPAEWRAMVRKYVEMMFARRKLEA
jgi:hypothetical protein